MQNQQLSDVKGKELVAAGHAFAKAIGMDTPLIEIAKMVSELASRLDCALVRGDAHMQAEMLWEKSMMAAIGEDGVGSVTKAIAELQAQRDALAAENATIKTMNDVLSEELRGYESDGAYDGPIAHKLWHSNSQTPATDAYLNSVRADAVNHAGKMIFATMNHQDKGVERALECIAEVELQYTLAAKLRAGEPS